jgi:hypothetical protein
LAEPLPSESLQEADRDKRLLRIAPLADRVGLRLEGEADISTQTELRRALAGLPADAGVIHLELAGLRFIDVICTRELMSLLKQHPEVRLILHSPPATLRGMIGLLWPGSRIEIAHPLSDPAASP